MDTTGAVDDVAADTSVVAEVAVVDADDTKDAVGEMTAVVDFFNEDGALLLNTGDGGTKFDDETN